MDLLEAIAYALSRGFWTAYLDVLKERSSAREETVTDDDRARAERLRAFIARMPIPPAGPSAS